MLRSTAQRPRKSDLVCVTCVCHWASPDEHPNANQQLAAMILESLVFMVFDCTDALGRGRREFHELARVRENSRLISFRHLRGCSFLLQILCRVSHPIRVAASHCDNLNSAIWLRRECDLVVLAQPQITIRMLNELSEFRIAGRPTLLL